MRNLGRLVFTLHLPVTVLLLLWAWLGRVLFEVGGWFLLFLPVFVGPWALLALGLTSLLAWTREQRPRAFTRWETISVLALWVGLLGVGTFVVDFGDAPGSDMSILTKLVGHSQSMVDLSWSLSVASGIVAVAGWLGLIVLLLLDRYRAAVAVSQVVSLHHGHDTQTQSRRG
jgi:hypothetical protein